MCFSYYLTNLKVCLTQLFIILGNDSEWVDIPDGGDLRNRFKKTSISERPALSAYRSGSIGNRLEYQQQQKGHGSTHALSNAPVMGTANLGVNRGSVANNSRRSLVRRESLAATPPLPMLSPEVTPRNSPAVSPSRNSNQYQRSYR